jgi:hypothetical protein
MQYLNEAIGLLMPGVRFRCMVAVQQEGDRAGAIGPEQLVLEGPSAAARAAVLAAEDGGAHNLVADEAHPQGGRLVLHWLRLADPRAVRPTDEAVAKMQTEITGWVAQAEAVRQRVYDGLAAPVVALAQGAGALGARRSLLTLTAREATALEHFERYMKQTVATDAHMRVVAPLPAVVLAPIVWPVTIHQEGIWLYGADNRAAWQEFVDG